MEFNSNKTDTFLKGLFSNKDLVGSYIKIGILGDKNYFKQKFFSIKEDLDLTIREIEDMLSENMDKNIYISPVTFDLATGKKDNVNNLPVLYADFDDYKGNALKDMSEEDRIYARESMMKELLGLKLAPTIVVGSGNGLQTYWKLKENINIKNNIEAIEEILKEFSKMTQNFKGDIAVTSLGHMLRVPGTKNYKDSNNIKDCEIIYENYNNTYEISDLFNKFKIDVHSKTEYNNYNGNTMYSTYEKLNANLDDVRIVAKECEFLCYMAKNPEDQNYLLWFHLALNLAVFSENGRMIFHKISKKYSSYNRDETDKIFEDALRNIKKGSYKPSTCSSICEAGFECTKSCKQKTPAGMMLSELMKKLNNNNKKIKEKEIDLDKELEYLIPKDNDIDNIKILERFINEKLYPSNHSILIKEAYLKKSMGILGIPAQGNIVTLKNQLKGLDKTTNNLVEIGNEIMQDKEFAYIAGELYIYKNGVYDKYTESLDKEIIEKLDDIYTKKGVQDIDFYIKNRTHVSVDNINNHTKENIICLSNYMLKIENEGKIELLSHNKNYYALNKINISYDANAGCPTWLKFLDDSFNLLDKEDKELTIQSIQEWFGYSLVGGNQLQKMMFIIGKTRTGKGVVLDTYASLLGSENISSIPISTLDKEFNTINLMDKLANIGPEIGEYEKFNIAFIKSIVGEDYISGRHLYKDSVSFKNNAKLMFASNHAPKILDSSNAMYERALCIPMNNYVPENRRDRSLKHKIEEELAGILNWAIGGRIRLFKRGRFIESPSMISLKQNIKERNNSVLYWFNNEKKLFDRSKSYIIFKKCFDDYKLFCEEEGFKPMIRGNFKRALNNIEGVTVKRPTRPNQDCVYIDWEERDKESIPIIENEKPKETINIVASQNEPQTKEPKTNKSVQEISMKNSDISKNNIEKMVEDEIDNNNHDRNAFA